MYVLSSCIEHIESIIATSVTHCDSIQWYSLHYFTPVPIKHYICHLLWELWCSMGSSAVMCMSLARCPCTWAAESGSYWLPTEASCARWIFCLDSFYFIAPRCTWEGHMNHERACIWPSIIWGFWPLSKKVINQVTSNFVYWLVWQAHKWLGYVGLILSHWCFLEWKNWEFVSLIV